MVLFDTRRPEWQPLINPVANLVYSATGDSVRDVFVAGEQVVADGRMRTIAVIAAILCGLCVTAPAASAQSWPAAKPITMRGAPLDLVQSAGVLHRLHIILL